MALDLYVLLIKCWWEHSMVDQLLIGLLTSCWKKVLPQFEIRFPIFRSRIECLQQSWKQKHERIDITPEIDLAEYCSLPQLLTLNRKSVFTSLVLPSYFFKCLSSQKRIFFLLQFFIFTGGGLSDYSAKFGNYCTSAS